MKIITKYFATLKQAEKYQYSLYNKYNSVELVLFPMFSESGQYHFKVS